MGAVTANLFKSTLNNVNWKCLIACFFSKLAICMKDAFELLPVIPGPECRPLWNWHPGEWVTHNNTTSWILCMRQSMFIFESGSCSGMFRGGWSLAGSQVACTVIGCFSPAWSREAVRSGFSVSDNSFLTRPTLLRFQLQYPVETLRRTQLRL